MIDVSLKYPMINILITLIFIVSLAAHSFGQTQYQLYNNDRDISIIQPLIDKNRQLVENIVNKSFCNSKLKEVSIVININKIGKFYLSRIDLQKPKLFYDLIDSALSNLELNEIKRGIDTKLFINFKRIDSNYIMNKNIRIKYYNCRNEDEVHKKVDLLFQQFSYSYKSKLSRVKSVEGVIVFKFSVDENGKVTDCCVLDNSLNDIEVNKDVVEMIKNSNFSKIDNPGDISEYVYQFILSANPNKLR